MRIISGSFKGKKIFQPKDNKTRPLKDLVKESIFNIISHSNKFTINLNKSNILDLFSGVGSFGIECLSRGAKKVVFVENYSEALVILKKNLNSLKSVKNYEILEKDAYSIDRLSIINDKFDLIFLDPPFKDRNSSNLLIRISEKKLLNKNGLVILHVHINENELHLQNFEIVEEKNYGMSKIIFLSNLN